MKVLFLDVDGVLNHDKTVERISHDHFASLFGVDGVLRDRFLKWREGKSLVVILSSAWRYYPEMKAELEKAGIKWDTETPRTRNPQNRGDEVAKTLEILRPLGVTHYAILDDNDWFNTDQKAHFVKTDPKVGLTDEDLSRLDKILGYANA